MPPTRLFKGPKGTRDLYPEDLLRQRYVTKAWRDVSIRHGFEQIDGPTYEESELYAVKSGEGILGELFQAFSGKSPEEVAQVQASGRAPFALRPEFTPTLARMYAARASTLSQPCKWFAMGPFFRAERPQRGRLREFWQWNVDFIGLPGGFTAEDAESAEAKAAADAEVVATSVALMRDLGLRESDVVAHMSDRIVLQRIAEYSKVPANEFDAVLQLFDRWDRLSPEQREFERERMGVTMSGWNGVVEARRKLENNPEAVQEIGLKEQDVAGLQILKSLCDVHLGSSWTRIQGLIVRGLAYYTGTVFEVIAEGERAVAGGGRYDNLIELFGGPATPAVGFGMGDVVLSLLLEDKGLMPEGAALLDAVSRPGASLRPEAFVISADDEETDALIDPLVAQLRRGVEAQAWLERDGRKPWDPDRYGEAGRFGSDGRDGRPTRAGSGGADGVRPMHARRSYKTTRNLKKLLADAEKQFSRFAVILHGPARVQLKDFDQRRDLTPADVLSDAASIAEFSVDPGSRAYVGRAIAALTAR